MKVLVTSVGSSPGLDIARSLRQDDALYIIGSDNGHWGKEVGKTVCNEIIHAPHASKETELYLEFLEEQSKKVDFIFIGLDIEVEHISNNDLKLYCPSHIPSNQASKVFLNKFDTYSKCSDKTFFPGSYIANNDESLTKALLDFNESAWLRPAEGTSGIGSYHAKSVDQAITWVKFCQSRGMNVDWLVQEFLPGRNINWTGLYKNGKLIAHASMERTEYFLANVSISGVTGQIKRSLTIEGKQITKASEIVVREVETDLNGIYSVDLREDENGIPKVTEVNPRFAGRNWLYTNAGMNLPLLTLYALTNNDYSNIPNNLKLGIEMYRQIDVEPMFRSINE